MKAERNTICQKSAKSSDLSALTTKLGLKWMSAKFVCSFGMAFTHSLILVYTQPKGVPA